MDAQRTSGSFGRSDISAPGRFERFPSGIDGLVYVFGRSGVEVEQVFASGWVDGGESLPVRRGDEFVVARDTTTRSVNVLKLHHCDMFRILT
jgi:hypothetical protein